MNDLVKVFFKITPDSEGYPSIGAESVWARETNVSSEYEVDNIPFFARDATLGDVLFADTEDGILWFKKIIRRSSNSLIRVVFFDHNALDRLSGSLLQLGCQTEYSKDFNLLAISVPGTVHLNAVRSYLESEKEGGSIDFEEPILRA